MNFNHLLAFITTVEKGSISAAAEDLHLTQPAVSKQIQSLEDFFGVRLLERLRREVQLTVAGQVVYCHARVICRELEKTRRELAEVTRLIRGKLLLGASTTPGQYILPRLIGGFRRKYPQVEVSMEIADSQTVIENVQSGEIELGVVGIKGRERGLSYKRLAEDRLVIIVPIEHHLAEAVSITPEQLKKESLVWRGPGSGTRRVLEECLGAAGFKLDPKQIVMELGSTEAIVSAVEAGLGISVVTCWAVEKSIKLGRLKVLQLQGVDLKRDLYLVRRRQTLSPAAEAFIDFLDNNPPRSSLF